MTPAATLTAAISAQKARKTERRLIRSVLSSDERCAHNFREDVASHPCAPVLDNDFAEDGRGRDWRIACGFVVAAHDQIDDTATFVSNVHDPMRERTLAMAEEHHVAFSERIGIDGLDSDRLPISNGGTHARAGRAKADRISLLEQIRAHVEKRWRVVLNGPPH